jgi:hypothetical protein
MKQKVSFLDKKNEQTGTLGEMLERKRGPHILRTCRTEVLLNIGVPIFLTIAFCECRIFLTDRRGWLKKIQTLVKGTFR